MKRPRDWRKTAKVAAVISGLAGMIGASLLGLQLVLDWRWSWTLAALAAFIYIVSCVLFIMAGRSLKLNSIELADKMIGKGEASERDMANLV